MSQRCDRCRRPLPADSRLWARLDRKHVYCSQACHDRPRRLLRLPASRELTLALLTATAYFAVLSSFFAWELFHQRREIEALRSLVGNRVAR